MVAGCTATRGRRGTPEESGFLGNYAQLQKSPDDPAALVYVRPGVQWSSYDSIQLASVGLWVSKETKNLSAERTCSTRHCTNGRCLRVSTFCFKGSAYVRS